MKTITGKAKFRKDSKFIYNDGSDYTFNIESVYIDFGNKGMGVYPAGSRQYNLTLVETPWEFWKDQSRRTRAVIHDSELIILELQHTISLPFNKVETLKLVEFIKENPELGLDEFIAANTDVIDEFPEIDLSTCNYQSMRDKYLIGEQPENQRLINVNVEVEIKD